MPKIVYLLIEIGELNILGTEFKNNNLIKKIIFLKCIIQK